MHKPIDAPDLTITSKYGKRKYKYLGKWIEDFHTGIDLIAKPRNNEAHIIAFEDGIVTKVNKTGTQYGKACYVRVKHSNGYYTLYYHEKSHSIKVNVGDKVKRGEILGTIGCTGQATGIHLHFQIDKGTNATSINPYDYIFKDKKLIPTYTKPDATIIWYTVKKGDNLSKIAKKYGTTWEKIYKDNKYTIGSNPNKIYPNQKLKIIK